MHSDPDLKRIMTCQIVIPGLRFLLLILLSSVYLGTSNPDIRGSLFIADDLQDSPSRHRCQQSSHYRKQDLDYCNDFAVRIRAQTLGQSLPPDGQVYWQQLPKQSRSALSSHPRPLPSPTNIPPESLSVTSRTVFARTIKFPSRSKHPGRRGHASPPSIASAEPPWNRPITPVATPTGKSSRWHVPVVTAPQNQGPVSSIFVPSSEPHKGSTTMPLSAPLMIFPSPPYHAVLRGHIPSTRSIDVSEPPRKILGMPVAVPPQRRTWGSTPVAIPSLSQGPVFSPPITLPPALPIGNSRTPVFSPSIVLLTHPHGGGVKGPVASYPSINMPEPPDKKPEVPVAVPLQGRSQRHMPVVMPPVSRGPVSSSFTLPSDPYQGSSKSPVVAPSMIFSSPPYHAGLRGHVASSPSINVSEPPQKRLELPMAVPPQRRSWRHIPVTIPPMSQGSLSPSQIILPPAPSIGNSRSPAFSPSIVLLTPPHRGGVKGPVVSPPSINVPEPPKKRPEMPVALPPQRSWRHVPVAIPPISQGSLSPPQIILPPAPSIGNSRSPAFSPSVVLLTPPHRVGVKGPVTSPSINVPEPPKKRPAMPVAVPPQRSWRHVPVAISPMSQGSLSSPPIILPPAPPIENSRSPVFSPSIVLLTPPHHGGVKGPVASPSSIEVSEPPLKRPEMPVAVPSHRSWRHVPVAIPPMSPGPVSSIFTPPSEPYRWSSRSPMLAPSMIFPSPPHHAGLRGHVASTPSSNVSEPPQKRPEKPMAVPPHRGSQMHTTVAIPSMSHGSVSSPPITLPPASPVGISRSPMFSPPILLPPPPHPGGVKGAVAYPPNIHVSGPPQSRPEIPVAVPPQRRSQRHMPVASPSMSHESVSSPPATHPPALAIGNSKGPVFAPANRLSTPAHHGGPVVSPPSINVAEPPRNRWRMPVAVPAYERSHRHTPVAVPSTSLGPVASQSITSPGSPLKDTRVPVAAPPRRRSHSHSPIAISPMSQGSVSSPSIALPPESPSRKSKTPAFAPSIIFPSPPNHQGSSSSPNIAPSEPPQRQSRTPLAAPPMQFPPPPPAEDCSTVSCADPLTYSPPGLPCGCVSPMQVELELGVALYAFFPLVPELALEIAAGTYLKPSQVRIMGANSDSQDQDKTLVIIDLVPLGQIFDNTTAFLIYNKFWQKKVMINETLFGDYSVIYVRYPGLPLSPPSAFSNPTHNGNPFGRSNGPSRVEPLGANIRKRNDKMGSGTIAVVALSSAIAAVICLGAVWIVLLKCSNQSRLPLIVEPTVVSSVTKRSGGGSILSGSLASSTSMSIGSSMATYTGSAKPFTLAELEKATDRFSPQNILGEGGFGRVYRGVLEDGMKVAVKVLTRDDQHGGREFIAEVEMLSRLHHRNLVKLIGICTEEHNRCLVYELIPNGSVESHLHGVDKETAPLDWDARMKIALGAARGLAYLHEDSSPRVIHRDFKASNILLEDDFTPKVSDFGLAKAASEEGSGHISTRVMGTFGYVAPEYAMTGHLLVKSDVYSYGVVLLELLSGRKPVDMSQPPGQENLVTWARSLLTSKEGLVILKDPALGSSVPFDNMARVAAIASMCVQPEVSHRPFMGEVVQALKLVYNDSDTSNGGGSGSCSQLGGSSAHDNEVKDVSGQMWCPSAQYVPDSTSFVTIDYDSGPLQTRGLEAEKPLSASALLPTSGRFVRQLSGSFGRHNSSGPLRTHRSKGLWYGEGSISEHHMSRHLSTGLDGDIHELWP